MSLGHFENIVFNVKNILKSEFQMYVHNAYQKDIKHT